MKINGISLRLRKAKRRVRREAAFELCFYKQFNNHPFYKH